MGMLTVIEMVPLYHDPHFTFRFTDDRIISRFHLEGVEAGQCVSVFKIDAGTGERLGLLATAAVGEGGWVDLPVPVVMKAGDAFIAVPGPAQEGRLILLHVAAGIRGRSAPPTAVVLPLLGGSGRRRSGPQLLMNAPRRRG